MAERVAFPRRVRNLAERGLVRLLALAGPGVVGDEFGADRHTHDQFVRPFFEESPHVELRWHEGVGRFTRQAAVDENLGVEVQAVEDQLLAFVFQEIGRHIELGPIPPRLGFRPAALGCVRAHGRFRHLAGLDQVQVNFARHLGGDPAVLCLLNFGQSGFADARELGGPDLPSAAEVSDFHSLLGNTLRRIRWNGLVVGRCGSA